MGAGVGSHPVEKGCYRAGRGYCTWAAYMLLACLCCCLETWRLLTHLPASPCRLSQPVTVASSASRCDAASLSFPVGSCAGSTCPVATGALTSATPAAAQPAPCQQLPAVTVAPKPGRCPAVGATSSVSVSVAGRCLVPGTGVRRCAMKGLVGDAPWRGPGCAPVVR